MGPDGSVYRHAPLEEGVAVCRGEDAIQHFIEKLLKIKQDFQDKLLIVAPKQFNDEEEETFKRATECYICRKALEEKTCARPLSHLIEV